MAAIIVRHDKVLVQRPTNDPDACYATVMGWRYLFVVENCFRLGDTLVQSLEHYLEVAIDRQDVESREAHLSQHWLPLAHLRDYDVRPHIVRDALVAGRLHTVSYLTTEPSTNRWTM
ncbi:MAG TPA: hypothetical protein VGC41_00040 [Kofleriaceae bacterium]